MDINEDRGSSKEYRDEAWRELRERGYKRVISVIRATTSLIRVRRYPKNWAILKDWGLCLIELGPSGYT